MSRRAHRIYAAAAALAFALSACDEEPKSADESPERKQKTDERTEQAPDLDWRRAVRSSAPEIDEEFGPFEGDCAPDRRLELPPRKRSAFPFEALEGCRLPEADDSSARYRLERIAYSNGDAAAIFVQFDRPGPLALRTLDRLVLPDLAARRRRSTSGDNALRVLSVRRKRLSAGAETGTLLGVDLVASDGDGDPVDRAVVYASTEDGTGRRLAKWRGPPTASRELVLPSSMRATATHAGVAVELGLETIRLRKWNDYPVRRPEGEISPAPVAFQRSALSPSDDETSWESRLATFVDGLGTGGEDAGGDPPRLTYGIAPTQTAPLGQVESLAEAIRSRSRARFQIVVRANDHLGAPSTAYGPRGGLRLALQSGGPEVERHAGERFLNLQVRATADGFHLVAGGEQLPPVEGCPDPGPTVCPANADVSIKEGVRRAEKLQREGTFEQSRRALDEALARLDWAQLYDNVRRIHERYSDASRVYLSAEPGLPATVLVRLVNLARFRFKLPDSEDCSSDFSDNADLLRAVPCRDDEERLRTMFDRPIWNVE